MIWPAVTTELTLSAPGNPEPSGHDVTFVIDHRFTNDELDALFDHADDAAPIREATRTLVQFDRQATTRTDAIVSALRTLETAGLRSSAVRSDDLLTPVTPRHVPLSPAAATRASAPSPPAPCGLVGFPAPLQS